ncbi:MAG: hypothetical protein D6730_01875 [Bacteroidetes bacterium]|nr:MAG: hypothetical protein D6730_01875 [Bacteroidota bacterium]
MKTLKCLITFALVAILFTATSCLDIVEEMSLNKDGSGVFTYTIDMSKSMDLLLALGESESEEAISTAEEDSPVEMDSTANFYELMKNEPDFQIDNPEFWKKANLHIQMSESQGLGKISFIIHFDDFDDISYFFENLNQMGQEEDAEDGFSQMLSMASGGTGFNFTELYRFEKNKFTRFKQQQSGWDELPEEDVQLIKLMVGSGTYTTIYHLPGKVKKASHSGSEISPDQSTVTVTHNMLDYMEGRVSFENKIKFK